MKKLNNKGYMLVEIIIASVMALVIACFLIDVTVKLVNKNNDYYLDSVLLVDKNIITKEIMDDINDSDLNLIGVIHKPNQYDNNIHVITLKFKDKNNDEVTRKINVSNTVISYIYGDDEENDIKYERTLNENLKIGDIEIKNDLGLLRIDIPAYTNFSDENYGINLMIKYNGELEESKLPEYYKYEQIVNLEGKDKILSKDFNLDNNVTKIKSCEIIYSNEYSEEEKKAIVNCELKDGKASVIVNTNEEKAFDKVEESCNKDYSDVQDAIKSQECSSFSCNYGGSLSGSTCYVTSTSTRTITGSYRAHYRCHYGQWVNVDTTDATYQPCESYETEVGNVSCTDDTPPPSGSCSPDGKTDSITATCTRKCRSSTTTSYGATCDSYVYSCPATYTKKEKKCYKCDDSGFTFNTTTSKCEGTCLVDNYKYNIKIKYK